MLFLKLLLKSIYPINVCDSKGWQGAREQLGVLVKEPQNDRLTAFTVPLLPKPRNSTLITVCDIDIFRMNWFQWENKLTCWPQ